jgi:succinate dehydrogenase / fumarate reductase, cytochrome b subunit
MTENVTVKHERPLSPHVFQYKWHILMFVSIMHRLTGIALTVGTGLLLGWLWSAAYSPSCFAWLNEFFSNIWGRGILFAWSLAFYFHFCNGIRHLFWDMGKGFEVKKAEKSAWAVLLFSGVLTLITWYYVLVGLKAA